MIQALPVETQEIVITASRSPQTEAETAASVMILDAERIARLGQPLVANLLRQAPSVAVSTSGPAGSLIDVRIRGAEANHTLLFVDGIRANDPAAGNVPRFELLNGDLFSRVEVVRGPQSALWGSEAVGGVIAVGGGNTRQEASQFGALGEYGSFGFGRAALQGNGKSGDLHLDGSIGWQTARGIDSFDGTGDRDGYRNLSGRLRAAWAPSSRFELGASGFGLSGRNDYDGYSDVTFLHADTLDSTHNRLSAGRVWTRIGEAHGPWTATISTSLLRSSNRNLLTKDEINQTWGKRWTLSGQLEHRFATGTIDHILIAAADHETEDFRARDVIYGGFSNQDRDRAHQGLTAEWRADAGPIKADVAVRKDIFSRFEDATTLRASLLGELGRGFFLAASYGEGIAQPTFFDLYGFFPGSFSGNPDLRPESSRGLELSGRYRGDRVRGSLTFYRQRLRNEIVDLFDSSTFESTTANRPELSRREGVEVEFGLTLGALARLSANYAYLKATQPGSIGTDQVREIRRPKHSGSIALDGARGSITYGASLAYSGERSDTDFDVFPARTVRLSPYFLADARLAYRLRSGMELFGRVANALDDRHQDVFGYRTEGRSVHAGLRLASRR